MANPYENRAGHAFWRPAVATAQWDALRDLYVPKFRITSDSRIAAAGSCFAQHISRHLRQNGYSVVDTEPTPPGLAPNRAAMYGYGLFSARFGNIYTVRHLLQLAREAIDPSGRDACVWSKDDRFFDAMRPSVEPTGLESAAEVIAHRRQHLANVRRLLIEMDVFVFTLGLTEAWEDLDGNVYPTAPGVIAGTFDRHLYRFKNFKCSDVVSDFNEFMSVVSTLRSTAGRPEARYILTVSPVPLVATADDAHILVATMRSKAVLRSAAGELADSSPNIDYFPSFELIASPWSPSSYFRENRREVTSEGVRLVMSYFFGAHGTASVAAESALSAASEEEEAFCDEAILEAMLT